MIGDLPFETQQKIRKAIGAGKKLDAVKIYRDAAKVKPSLLECKTIIENEMDRLKGESSGSSRQLESGAGSADMDQILDCIFAHKKLDAVKIYCNSSGVSLMTGKKFIEELIDQLQEECPEQFKGGDGYQTGCASMSFVLVAAVYVALTLANWIRF